MSVCEHCGKEIGPEAIQGVCPKCLMKAGLESASVSASSAKIELPPLEALREQFPQLEILEFLGRGGMGAVYKARQPQLDRIVALKILLPDIGRDPAFAERFAIEARALARLNHPNILTIHDFGQVGDLFYFVMEFVDGLNLRELLDAERIAAREALAIVPQICDALQFAHDHGIVHRDIKPENILLDRLGRVKVADFGLAKLMGGAEPAAPQGSIAASFTLTEAGKVLGTPHYMAPEQMERPREVDHRADIYALGVVFYQMLTGELPGQTLEPPSHKVRLDVRLDEVVLRALEKLPELRYQQVSEVKTHIETIAETLGEGGTEPKARVSEDEPEPARVGAPSPPADPGTPPRFSLLALWGAFAAVRIIWLWVKILLSGEAKQYLIESEPDRINYFWETFRASFFWETLRASIVLCFSSSEFWVVSCLATVVGWIAVTDIRRSSGRLTGLRLATFGGLVFPLFVLDVAIFYFFYAIVNMSEIRYRWYSGDFFCRGILLLLSGCVVLLIAWVDKWVVRRVWQAVKYSTLPLVESIQEEFRKTLAPTSLAETETSPRHSLLAVAGVCWAALFFLLALLMFNVHGLEITPMREYDGAMWGSYLLGLILRVVGFAAPLGTTILGWMAVSRIRHSARRVFGLKLPVFTGLLFPLLALDFLLFGSLHLIGEEIYLKFDSIPKNIYYSNLISLLFAGVAFALFAWTDYLIVRRVWRAVSIPALPVIESIQNEFGKEIASPSPLEAKIFPVVPQDAPPVSDERSVGTRESPEEHPNPPSNDFPSATPDRGDLPPSTGLFAALGVAATYAATVLYGFLCLLLSTRAWMGGVFVLAGCASAPLVFLLKRFASRETLRSVFKSGAWLAWGAALPTIGFALFFLCALVLEKGKWNPGAEEAFVVPLVWLGAFLLPVCARRLWRAAQVSLPPDAVPPTVPAPPFRFSRLAIDGACLGQLALLMFLLAISGWSIPFSGFNNSDAPWLVSQFIRTLPHQLGIVAVFAMTIIGWMAVSQIRRSEGRIYGMGLAVFEGLFLPLLMLDAVIAYLFLILDRLIVHPDLVSVVLTIAAVCLIGLVDYCIVRRVWRAVNQSQREAGTDPNPLERNASSLPPPAGGWRPVLLAGGWHTILLLVVGSLLVFEVPAVVALYAETAREIPWATRQVIVGSQLFINYGLLLFPLLVMVDLFLCWLAQNQGGRKWLRAWSILYVLTAASVAALIVLVLYLPVRLTSASTASKSTETLSDSERQYQEGIGPDVAFFQSAISESRVELKGRALAGTRLAFYLGDNPEDGWSCTLPNTTSRFSIKVEKRSNNALDCRVLDEIAHTEIFSKDSIKTMGEVSLSQGTLSFFSPEGSLIPPRRFGMDIWKVGEWTSSSGEKRPVFVSLTPPAAYISPSGNTDPAPEEPAPDPALVEKKPELRFLAWQSSEMDQHDRELDQAWHPDGSSVAVQSAERKQLGEMNRSFIGDMTNPGQYFLYLWLEHPLLDSDSIAEMQILDANGQSLKLGPHSGAHVRPVTSGGWMACILSEDDNAKWPSQSNLRLRYTIRPWKEEGTIPSDYNTSGNWSLSGLPHGLSVTSVGQDTEGNAFIAVTRDLTVDPDIQCGFVAITRDGRRRMCRSQISARQGNLLPEKLKVETPLSQIQEFRLLSRPFREAEFKDVILRPNPGKAQKSATAEAVSITPAGVSLTTATAPTSTTTATAPSASPDDTLTNSIGMKLKRIPAGSFLMGVPYNDTKRGNYDDPQHKVTLTKPYYLGVYEVTQEQYEKVMGTNPSKYKGTKRPVEGVKWNDAQEFCRNLSRLEKDMTLKTAVDSCSRSASVAN